MAKTIDSSAKELIRNSPEAWAKLSHLVSEDAEITSDDADTSTIVGSSDKVTKVLENDLIRYLIMEFQAQFDELLLPSCVVRDAAVRRSKGKIIVDTVIFFAHPNTLPRDPNLGEYRQERHAGPPSIFYYTAIKLWELDPDEILALDPRMAPLAALAKVDSGELPALVGRMEQKIATLDSQEEQNKFWTMAYWLAGVRWRNKAMLDTLFEGKFKMIDSVTFQGTLEDGKIALGKEFVLEWMQERFGTIPENIQQKVEAMNNLDRIREIRRELAKVNSLDEVIALLD